MHKKFANVQKNNYLCTKIQTLCNEYISQFQFIY